MHRFASRGERWPLLVFLFLVLVLLAALNTAHPYTRRLHLLTSLSHHGKKAVARRQMSVAEDELSSLWARRWQPNTVEMAAVHAAGREALQYSRVPYEGDAQALTQHAHKCIDVFRRWNDGGTTGMDEHEAYGTNVTVVAAEVTTKWMDSRTGSAHGAAEWVLPSTKGSFASRLLFFPGGGYHHCTPATYRPFTSRLAQATGLPVLAIDYRKAPQFTFPHIVQDATDALAWVWSNSPNGKEEAEQVFLVGDSAGGGLALSCILHVLELRMQNNTAPKLPTAAVTISAFTDVSCSFPSYVQRYWKEESKSGDPIFSGGPEQLHEDLMHAMETGRVLVGSDGTLKHPLASPAFAPPDLLPHFPPLYMLVGEAEMMLDDTVFFYSRAKEAGVESKLEVYADMWHVWILYSEGAGILSSLQEARTAFRGIADFIRAQ